MRERERDIRRKRQRREKAKKARIKILIAQSKTEIVKKNTEVAEEIKEKKVVQRKKPTTKIVSAKKTEKSKAAEDVPLS